MTHAVMETVSVITGATGLIGSHVAERLCERGEPVRALVRPSSDTWFLRTLPVELVVANLPFCRAKIGRRRATAACGINEPTSNR